MKCGIISFLICFVTNLNSQSFKEVLTVPFEGVRLSSQGFADIDNDGDLDLLLTGRLNGTSPVKSSDLYFNDGSGNFTMKDNTKIEGVTFGSISFADVDNDEDQDLMITGSNSLNFKISTLYLNDGRGNYTEQNNTPFIGVDQSSSSFADVDNDGDMDIMICGEAEGFRGTSTLYLNNGTGQFTESLENEFLWIADGDIQFGDVDGDEDLDLIISGQHSPAINSGPITVLYINNGFGVFEQDDNFSVLPLSSGTVDLIDIDGDQDLDLFITGSNNSVSPSQNESSLYKNDGSGKFTEVTDINIIGVNLSSTDFADIDGDQDLDLFLCGKWDSPDLNDSYISKLYSNDGEGNFIEVLPNTFENLAFGSSGFIDVDDDKDMDLIITGWSSGAPSTSVAKLYLNQMTTSVSNLELPNTTFKIFPNPAASNHVKINFYSAEESRLQISLLDFSGKKVVEKHIQSTIGDNSISIDLAPFPKGKYLIKMTNRDQSSSQILILH